jgi:hypothetical protein
VTSLLTASPSRKDQAMSQILACMTNIPTNRSIDERISIQQFLSEPEGE